MLTQDGCTHREKAGSAEVNLRDSCNLATGTDAHRADLIASDPDQKKSYRKMRGCLVLAFGEQFYLIFTFTEKRKLRHQLNTSESD